MLIGVLSIFIAFGLIWVIKDVLFFDNSKRGIRNEGKQTAIISCVSQDVMDTTVSMFDEVKNGKIMNNLIKNSSVAFNEEKNLCTYREFLNKDIFSSIDKL